MTAEKKNKKQANNKQYIIFKSVESNIRADLACLLIYRRFHKI